MRPVILDRRKSGAHQGVTYHFSWVVPGVANGNLDFTKSQKYRDIVVTALERGIDIGGDNRMDLMLWEKNALAVGGKIGPRS
jgi:hypothetical protein